MDDRPALDGKLLDVFEAIRLEARACDNRPLTLDEIANRAKLHDRSHAGKYVKKLAEMGYVRQLPKHKGVEVIGERPGCSLPLVGSVAAGKPVFRPRDDGERFNFNDAFGGPENVMFEIKGQSMIEAHIAPGDFIVVRKTPDAEDGQKVVCMIDGAYTLKVLERRRGVVHLHPCNGAVPPIKLDPKKENCIVGVLVGVVRKER